MSNARILQGDGLLHAYVPHTTAAITINEGYDPDVVADVVPVVEPDVVAVVVPVVVPVVEPVVVPEVEPVPVPVPVPVVVPDVLVDLPLPPNMNTAGVPKPLSIACCSAANSNSEGCCAGTGFPQGRLL